MGTRQQNEQKFPDWESLPNGGRRYWRDVTGHSGWRARYLKEVDANENRQLVEVHEKYPVDKGHRKV
jgi:hypothetical protein